MSHTSTREAYRCLNTCLSQRCVCSGRGEFRCTDAQSHRVTKVITLSGDGAAPLYRYTICGRHLSIGSRGSHTHLISLYKYTILYIEFAYLSRVKEIESEKDSLCVRLPRNPLFEHAT